MRNCNLLKSRGVYNNDERKRIFKKFRAFETGQRVDINNLYGYEKDRE
jgi:hypothetical protein